MCSTVICRVFLLVINVFNNSLNSSFESGGINIIVITNASTIEKASDFCLVKTWTLGHWFIPEVSL